jgi:hypothetical protein
LNPQSLDREPSGLTTRPRLLALFFFSLFVSLEKLDKTSQLTKLKIDYSINCNKLELFITKNLNFFVDLKQNSLPG